MFFPRVHKEAELGPLRALSGSIQLRYITRTTVSCGSLRNWPNHKLRRSAPDKQCLGPADHAEAQVINDHGNCRNNGVRAIYCHNDIRQSLQARQIMRVNPPCRLKVYCAHHAPTNYRQHDGIMDKDTVTIKTWTHMRPQRIIACDAAWNLVPHIFLPNFRLCRIGAMWVQHCCVHCQHSSHSAGGHEAAILVHVVELHGTAPAHTAGHRSLDEFCSSLETSMPGFIHILRLMPPVSTTHATSRFLCDAECSGHLVLIILCRRWQSHWQPFAQQTIASVAPPALQLHHRHGCFPYVSC
mmetsp:Transcript_110339/g.200746  ORF Transcript_110339/g.200746 Transcript_110339/m.200746 type:complete len:298 (+) Transcript_110339:231-1124(+)